MNEGHRLVDEECREALCDVRCWCRVAYKNGEIAVHLDDERLAGTHVLGGVEIVLLLAQARLEPPTAYRVSAPGKNEDPTTPRPPPTRHEPKSLGESAQAGVGSAHLRCTSL